MNLDQISHKFYDGPNNLADPSIIAAETSQKDNPHLGKAIKSDNREDFMKVLVKI